MRKFNAALIDFTTFAAIAIPSCYVVEVSSLDETVWVMLIGYWVFSAAFKLGNFASYMYLRMTGPDQD